MRYWSRVQRNWVAVALALVAAVNQQVSALTPDQVLVVYNSQGPDGNANGTADSLDVYNAYVAARPGVLGFDLNNAAIAPGNISYANFESQIRDPLRNYLAANNLADQVVAITLTKGLPHRIQDTDNAGIAGTPSSVATEFINGDATLASVDSELTMLWQNLRTTPGAGEAGGAFDSYADNLILNPYYGSTSSVTSFSRSNITATKAYGSLVANLGNGLQQIGYYFADDGNNVSDGGDIYLVTRLDGDSVEHVVGAIQRAGNIQINKTTDKIVIDENSTLGPSGNFDGNDYATAATTLSSGGFVNVTYDSGASFLIGENGTVADVNKVAVTGNVAAVVTYGGNHASNGDQDEYVFTWQGQLVNGAVFNSMESYNGQALGGLDEFGDLGSVAEWLAAGGTFATGNVQEPFSFTVANSTILLDRFLLQGYSWAEAAYMAMPYLSWQQIVIGDPLAVIPEPGTACILLLVSVVAMRRRRRGCGVSL